MPRRSTKQANSPVAKALVKREITTMEVAEKTGLKQPTVWRHAYDDQIMSFQAMELYNKHLKIPFSELRKWNNSLLQQQRQQHDNDSNEQGGSYEPTNGGGAGQ